MIDRTSNKPLYRQVEAFLQGEVQRGRWPSGSAVSSPRLLAEELNVNYLTVRRAFMRLIEAGVLVGLQGRGTYVASGATKRRLLFVSGFDLSSDDTSPVFRSMFRATQKHARRLGYVLDEVYLSPEEPALERKYGDEGYLGHYDGVIFSGCFSDHWFLRLVREKRKPSVLLGESDHAEVGYDPYHLYWLGLSGFDANDPSPINVISYVGKEQRLGGLADLLDLNVVYFSIPPDLHSMGAVERWGYYCASCALAKENGARRWFISDDVAARGASRAMLANKDRAQTDHHVAVRCDTNQIVPLGVPTTWILTSGRQTARQGIKVLLEQIDGALPSRVALRPQVVSDHNRHMQRLLGFDGRGASPRQITPSAQTLETIEPF